MTILEPYPVGVPTPEPSPLTIPFWEACLRGELTYQHCLECGQANFDPQPICRFCRSPSLDWRVSAGIGAVCTWTVVWRPQMPAFPTPYAPVIVRLAEGYDMVSSLISCDPDEIQRGMEVGVEFHSIGEGFALPYFAPLA